MKKKRLKKELKQAYDMIYDDEFKIFGVELFVELIGYEDEAEIVAAIMDSGYDWMKDGDEVLVEFFVPWED